MEQKKHIVIFSHGFGVDKTDLGLFTDIAEVLKKHNIESIMFDYNEINTGKKEVTVKSFTAQAQMLQAVINETAQKYPDAVIDVIGHSQGCVVIALVELIHIRKVLLLAPFFHTDIQKVIERHKKFPSSVINFTGISRRVRSDGTVSIVPPEYWSERFAMNIYEIYNKLALKNDMTIIRAGEDQIMESPDLLKIFNANVISIHGNHEFKNEHREGLLKIVEKIIAE